jgi:signal transduction histidine kinase
MVSLLVVEEVRSSRPLAGRLLTGRLLTRRTLMPAWAVFAAVNLWLMFLLPGSETIPFHFIWFSLALVYGLAPWRLATMVTTLALVSATTFFVLQHHAAGGYIGVEELSEVPLMAAIFLAMVWHVRRRQDALTEMERLAAVEHDRAETEQMFVRLVSHEMRAPITVARGYAELVRDASPDAQTGDDCAIVLDELATLDRSTQRLAMLMSPESADDLARADVDELLEHARRRWAPAAHRRWRVESAAGAAMLDVERLQTALDCLVENAVKFTSDDDSIGLCGRREPEHVVIEVTDSGSGIPPGDLPYVFDAFYRGANSAAQQGTGLGLSIVRRIVEARGGTAAAASRLGEGTTFTLRLPITGQRDERPVTAPGVLDGAVRRRWRAASPLA